MENEQCIGVADASKFSSPVPIIGVYITASTLVCLLFFMCDVFQGYRSNKPWLPCRYFSLNSLTLTLLGIATKLPVDLTTAMPSFQDQLSKLSGTVLIIVCMGVFMPSLGEMEGFELLGNMVSLTVLVVIVTVNICVQMITGVIFTFYTVEHAISLSLLLLALIGMWYVTFLRTWIARETTDLHNSFLETNYIEDEGEALLGKVRGLQHKYEAIYKSNPQVTVCLFTNYVTYVAMLSTLSVFVIFVAFYRTYILKQVEFCKGESDYKWSMWKLVVAQIFTSVVGTVAIICRSVFYACRRDDSVKAKTKTIGIHKFRLFAKIISNWRICHLPWFIATTGILPALEEVAIFILFVVHLLMRWTDLIVTLVIQSARKVVVWICEKNIDGYRSNSSSIFPYLGEKASKQTSEWIKECEKDYPCHLIQLLSTSLQKPPPLQLQQQQQQGCPRIIALVFLVRIAEVSMPPDLCEPLGHALDEIIDILCFIGRGIWMIGSSFNHVTAKLAKELWMSRDSKSHWFQKLLLVKYLPKSHSPSEFDLDHAFVIIQEILTNLHGVPVAETSEGNAVTKILIEMTSVASFVELRDRIDQQFADTLYFFLPQLPRMISDYVSQSPITEHEERLRIALKFMCKFDQLKPHAKWLTPDPEVHNPRMESIYPIIPSDVALSIAPEA